MLLPAQPGLHPDLLVGGGKGGVIYLVDRNNMGQFNSSTDNVVQKVSTGHVFTSSPAYFDGMIYYHGFTDVLKAFSVTNGALSAALSRNQRRELFVSRRDAEHFFVRQLRERNRVGVAIQRDE